MGEEEQQEQEQEQETPTTASTSTQQVEEEEEELAVVVVVEEEGVYKEKQQVQLQQQQQNFVIREVSDRLIKGDLRAQIEAAREIRRLVRKSTSPKTRCKLGASGVIQPLISMLLSSNFDACHSSLLALLNLAVRNEGNKVKIVEAGAIPPLVDLLKFQSGTGLRELATAAILTLSAADQNKSAIVASGVSPLLVQILSSGSMQGRVDAVTALHNLSVCPENLHPVVDPKAVFPLVNLLKESKKYSKFAEKATALLELLSKTEEGRVAITDSDGGILTLVETVEDGSLVSTQHAVCALLSLCQSCRDKYRELILKEGAIPGLLRLTAEGTKVAQERARTLLDLLREKPPQKRLPSSVLERIAYDIASRVDGSENAAETAKKLLQDMVQRSMAESHTISKIPTT